jgi:hypothetical protein
MDERGGRAVTATWLQVSRNRLEIDHYGQGRGSPAAGRNVLNVP